MTTLSRDIEAATCKDYDLIIVGGGIYGACLTLESARRGLKPLLVERDDFGGATSWNSLRIIHGGLRYLQSLDLARFRRSVSEQAWWLAQFPDLVQPLPCLMPLYNQGLRRTSVMRAAMAANKFLSSRTRAQQFGERARDLLGSGSVISGEETIDVFASVDQQGLRGGAIWHDAVIPSPQRLMVEILRWASCCGATVLNYVSCEEVLRRNDSAIGILARCQESERRFELNAPNVVTCAGPWNSTGRDDAGLALAFNLVLSRLPLANHGLAVTAKRARAPTYFMVPYGQKTMVGTSHLPLRTQSRPTNADIDEFLDDLNLAIPGYRISRDEVVSVMAGRLPAKRRGAAQPAKRPVICRCQDRIQGHYGVTGVKYTTARWVAQKTLSRIMRDTFRTSLPAYNDVARPAVSERQSLTDNLDAAEVGPRILAWMKSESALHIDDLVLRRNDTDPSAVPDVAVAVMRSIGWDPARISEELARLEQCGIPYTTR